MGRILDIVGVLLLSFAVYAENVVATIDSYNSASLSGDVPESLSVSFTNTTGSKGRVSKDQTATLTLSNWPEATIQSVTLYVYSNASAGAATVSLSINDDTRLVAQGNYNQWPGINAYSKDPLPLSALTQTASVADGSSLMVKIEGTVNSVYLQSIAVEYTITPPVSHTVTLCYPANGGARDTIITEPHPGAGIELPSVPQEDSALIDDGMTWYWMGWCEQPVSTQSASPLCWQLGDWYGPEADVTLYALYTNLPMQTIRQDTSFVSGEYALVFVDSISPADKQPRALAGNWQSGKIPMVDLPMYQNEAGEWLWVTDYLDDTYRYQLTFSKDSLTIQHVATHSWIGHNKSSGSNTQCPWAWTRTAEGSILIYNDMSSTTPVETHCLSFKTDLETGAAYGVYNNDIFRPDYPHWRLYPLASVPTEQDALFSTLPFYVSLPADVTVPNRCKKILDHHGQLRIYSNQKIYNLLGSPIR
ncbi:MAG: hypothetical protein MJZ48_01740 [Paludibacteraceae bacterium]|nr:hypothetical protein [Paludibacteraceae bacterium]